MDSSKQREHVFWHELRSPAGTLVTLLDVASQGFAGEAPAELRDLIERAKRQADRMMAMIAAAHDVERLRWGTLVLRRETVDLSAALGVAAAAVEATAKARGVALQVQPPTSGVEATADPVQLARCLECLLRAAVEASSRGGTVAAEVSAVEGARVVRAKVAAPAHPEAMAAAFTLESSLGIRGGSGLGLYEARLLIGAMSGTAGSEGGTLELRFFE